MNLEGFDITIVEADGQFRFLQAGNGPAPGFRFGDARTIPKGGINPHGTVFADPVGAARYKPGIADILTPVRVFELLQTPQGTSTHHP